MVNMIKKSLYRMVLENGYAGMTLFHLTVAGFEVRTYRLCQRVLMFHHFPNEEGVGNDCLVRSTDFVYRNIRNNHEDLRKGHPIASFISSVTQSGYKRLPDGRYKLLSRNLCLQSNLSTVRRSLTRK